MWWKAGYENNYDDDDVDKHHHPFWNYYQALSSYQVWKRKENFINVQKWNNILDVSIFAEAFEQIYSDREHDKSSKIIKSFKSFSAPRQTSTFAFCRDKADEEDCLSKTKLIGSKQKRSKSETRTRSSFMLWLVSRIHFDLISLSWFESALRSNLLFFLLSESFSYLSNHFHVPVVVLALF